MAGGDTGEGGGNELIHGGVAAGGIMMVKGELPGVRGDRHIGRVFDSAVSPTDFRRVFGGRVLRVVNDEIGVAEEFDMGDITAFAGFQVTFGRGPSVGFVIGGVNHAGAIGFEAIADGKRGVIEILRGDCDICY